MTNEPFSGITRNTHQCHMLQLTVSSSMRRSPWTTPCGSLFDGAESEYIQNSMGNNNNKITDV